MPLQFALKILPVQQVSLSFMVHPHASFQNACMDHINIFVTANINIHISSSKPILLNVNGVSWDILETCTVPWGTCRYYKAITNEPKPAYNALSMIVFIKKFLHVHHAYHCRNCALLSICLHIVQTFSAELCIIHYLKQHRFNQQKCVGVCAKNYPHMISFKCHLHICSISLWLVVGVFTVALADWTMKSGQTVWKTHWPQKRTFHFWTEMHQLSVECDFPDFKHNNNIIVIIKLTNWACSD